MKYAYGIVPGVSGNEQETACQDSIRILEENGVSVISLRANTAASVTTERFEEFYSSEDDGYVKGEVLEAVRETAGSDNSQLFVAVKENRYLAGHMGGGLIAVLNGGCSVLSKPEGENREKADLRICKGELQEPFGFMLLSDGACLSLYECGTGNLSPACGTFFEWLKEYDGETVSKALADNINKYFVKDVKGDISVAVMVTDESETAAGDAAVEDGTAEDEKTLKGRNYIKYLIAAVLVVILTVAAVLTINMPGDTGEKGQGKAGSNTPAALSENSNTAGLSGSVPLVSFSADNPITYDSGTYQVGENIPAGEYFFWTGEMLAPDSVKVNDFTCLSRELYCLTVRVNEGDTLTSDYRFTEAENVNPVKAANGILISGKYKIGKDIAPGEYKISPIDKSKAGRYYSVLDGEISNKTEFNEEAAVVVPEEGYIVFYDSALAVQ